MLMNMKELLAVANENNFAVPAFNISDYNMFNGIMEASEEKNAPVIIAIHPDELHHVGADMVQAVRARIEKSPIPATARCSRSRRMALTKRWPRYARRSRI